MKTLPLQALLDFARSHPDRVFNLDSCTECLACKTAGSGHVMYNFRRFHAGGEYNKVDDRFASLCRELSPTFEFTGAELADMIQRLIDGVHPHQVATEI